LNSLRITHKIDNYSGSIGRRYARADEIAIPFAITIDFDSIKEPFTVTLRERDSCEQVLVEIDKIAILIKDLCERKMNWQMVCEKYTKKEIKEL
jgi:glycyl-tRNA synthetase